jgi:hypothetical protein
MKQYLGDRRLESQSGLPGTGSDTKAGSGEIQGRVRGFDEKMRKGSRHERRLLS